MRRSLWRETSDRVSRLFRPLRGELLETRCLLSSTPELLSEPSLPVAELLDTASNSLVAPPSADQFAPMEVLSGDSLAADIVVEPPAPTSLFDTAAGGEPGESASSPVIPATESAPATDAEGPSTTEDSSDVSSKGDSGADPIEPLLGRTPAEQSDATALTDDVPEGEATQDPASPAGLDLRDVLQKAAGSHRRGGNSNIASFSNAASFQDTAVNETAADSPPSMVLPSSDDLGQTNGAAIPPVQPSEGDDAAQDHIFANLALANRDISGLLENAHASAHLPARPFQAGAPANRSDDIDLLSAVTDWRHFERLSSAMAQFLADAGQENVSASAASAAAGILVFVTPQTAAAGSVGRTAELSSRQASVREASARRRIAIQSAHDQVMASGDDEPWPGFVQLVEQELVEQELIEAGLVPLEAQPSRRDTIEAELAQVKDQLARQERLAMVGQVAASIAHDLRNPLGVVHTAVYLLRRCLAADDPKPQSYLEAIDAEIETANRIISNLMEVVRAKDAVKQSIDFGSTIRQVFERIQNRGEIECRIDCRPEPFTVDADPVQLRQVLGNLLTNGAEAMGGKGEIRIEARQDGGFDVLTVRDNGPGIPPEIRQTLFEPLVSTRAKGTGLGLAICRQIVQRHGGTIELLAADGGATFQIRLPQSAPLSPPPAD